MNESLNHLQIKYFLTCHLQNRSLGDVRIFKFILKLTGSIERTREFLETEGFTKGEINRTIRSINRERTRYQLKLKTAIRK